MKARATVVWRNGLPFCIRFGDFYFSDIHALDKARYVFLQHNRLPQRFAALYDGGQFIVAETGFGTGLNFICTWRCFNQYAPSNSRLHFISIEKYPLVTADLAQALALWPELAIEARALLPQYDSLTPGWQRLLFDNGRVTLTLIIADALEGLRDTDAEVDAWFLDGFAPHKNPEMWQPELLGAIAALCHGGSTFATFTSADTVQRALVEQGFYVQRGRGLQQQPPLCYGHLQHCPQPAWRAPWFARPPLAQDKTALIIGAGLAGTSTAYSLAQRGWEVTVIDRQLTIASEASGNPQAVLYAKLSAHFPPLTRLNLAGYGYTLRLLSQQLGNNHNAWQNCGVLQLAGDQVHTSQQQKLAAAGLPSQLLQWLTASQASDVAGVPIASPALYFPQAGWVAPPALSASLCQHPAIRLCLLSQIIELVWDNLSQQWIAMSPTGAVAAASTVVLATATNTAAFRATCHLPLKRIRGQLTLTRATVASAALKSILCGEGYILPKWQEQHCVGATFKLHTDDITVQATEHAENLAMLRQLSLPLYQALCGPNAWPLITGGRAALRCASPDYLPIIGPLVSPEAFEAAWHPLRQNATQQLTETAVWVPGIYVTTAHGSRGLISAPLAGEILAAYLNGEPAPLPHTLMAAVHPNRFLLRHLIRHKLWS